MATARVVDAADESKNKEPSVKEGGVKPWARRWRWWWLFSKARRLCILFGSCTLSINWVNWISSFEICRDWVKSGASNEWTVRG